MLVRQPEPNRDSEAFLSALAGEISVLPNELTARRHITAAASAARSARSSRRSAVVRWVAAVTAVSTLFGSGGIALAGGLPAPLQTVVADMARALPVPLDIPYPTIAGQVIAGDRPANRLLRPEDGEIEIDPYQPSAATTGAASSPAAASTAVEPSPDLRDGDLDEGVSPASCDLEDELENRDRLDREELRELRFRIRQVCGLEFVDPPRFATEDGQGRDHENGGEDRDRRDGQQGDEDNSFGSRGWEGSDRSIDGSDRDEQEGRNDHYRERSSDDDPD